MGNGKVGALPQTMWLALGGFDPRSNVSDGNIQTATCIAAYQESTYDLVGGERKDSSPDP